VKIIALDTTTRAGSAALLDDDRILDEREGDPRRTHAERLPGEITALLDAHHVTFADVDLYAVACGPGSFTGLRIGIATMQGLAFVGGRRIVGVSALDALAHAGSADLAPGAVVAAWMDAHRRDVFSALYRVQAAPLYDEHRLEIIEGAAVDTPAATLDRGRRHLSGAPSFIGDGATLYGDVVVTAVPSARIVPMPLLAGTVGRLALRASRRGDAVDPAGLQPLYVRRPDAEVARERALEP